MRRCTDWFWLFPLVPPFPKVKGDFRRGHSEIKFDLLETNFLKKSHNSQREDCNIIIKQTF